MGLACCIAGKGTLEKIRDSYRAKVRKHMRTSSTARGIHPDAEQTERKHAARAKISQKRAEADIKKRDSVKEELLPEMSKFKLKSYIAKAKGEGDKREAGMNLAVLKTLGSYDGKKAKVKATNTEETFDLITQYAGAITNQVKTGKFGFNKKK